MRTGDVKAALRRYFNPREYALMFEVSNGTGANARRHADAVVMNLWPSRGLLIEGFEIKVSRSDWRRELSLPEKAEAVAQYCDKWWIVSPENIVQAHELPALWGHMEVLPNGSLRVKKPAPKKNLDTVTPLNRNFVAAMLRRASEVDAGEVEAAVRLKTAELEKQYEARVERAVTFRAREAEKVLEKVRTLEKAGIDLNTVYDDTTAKKQFALGQKVDDIVSRISYLSYSLKSALEQVTEFEKLVDTGESETI
ncbi:hypothetical protein KEU06_08725 [Pseudaminobacter sp. 19-2017]|uniref:Uncharacterized protein n=1 Tax=Pseudaminobacter soli (ex Zhang et al. 2022) TaxID=2831468 RepID=A0A942I8X9_9HYPH|nr:hypothetical protein [Pseudaminobacter soli]MBS3648711.1 hypothetical protein [Pseudaminobacter soli]